MPGIIYFPTMEKRQYVQTIKQRYMSGGWNSCEQFVKEQMLRFIGGDIIDTKYPYPCLTQLTGLKKIRISKGYFTFIDIDVQEILMSQDLGCTWKNAPREQLKQPAGTTNQTTLITYGVDEINGKGKE